MIRSLTNLVDDILTEVKTAKLTELASQQIIKEAVAHPILKTDLGCALKKLAETIRENATDVTIGDVKAFVAGVQNAI